MVLAVDTTKTPGHRQLYIYNKVTINLRTPQDVHANKHMTGTVYGDGDDRRAWTPSINGNGVANANS